MDNGIDDPLGETVVDEYGTEMVTSCKKLR